MEPPALTGRGRGTTLTEIVSLGIVVAALIVAAAIVVIAEEGQAAAIGRMAILGLSSAGLALFLSRLLRRD